MLSLDPIRPYLDLLKVGAALAIATVLFVSGCNHGKRNQAADDLAEMDGLRHELLVASTALRGAADALNVVNSETKAVETAAAVQAKQAEAAVAAAKDRAKDLRAQLAKAEADLEHAKREPNCRLLLETPSCAAFR